MDLWIRSQDKTILTKINEIDICENPNGTWWFNIGTCIGTYSTKERALEVLDEIHNRIATLTAIDLMGVNDTNLKVFNKYLKENSCSVVYEMPKE